MEVVPIDRVVGGVSGWESAGDFEGLAVSANCAITEFNGILSGDEFAFKHHRPRWRPAEYIAEVTAEWAVIEARNCESRKIEPQIIGNKNPVKIRVSTHFIITCVLWAGLALTMTMMQLAFKRNDRDATNLFGICSGVLCCAATLSSFLLASHYVARRELEKSRTRAQIRSGAPDLPYIARHSKGAQIVALSLVLALGLLIGFFLYRPHSGSAWLLCALGLLFCANSVYVYRIWMTTMCFENDRISIRVSPFVGFSEPYANITSIRAKQGVLELHFKDGRKMSRWSGLGDSDKIAKILMQKTHVLPT